MDFIDSLRQHSARVSKMKDQIQTEEATKTSLIMPFFQSILGFDIFNPDEFVPEFTADVGTKKGEKVDYAIIVDGQPAILIEAKWCGEPLEKHDSQLFRYFGTTKAKFAILTNGVIYKFFTDLEMQNRMDLKPFLEIDMLNLKERAATELKKFHKDTFDINELASSATTLKYSNDIKGYFSAQLKAPSDDFVRHILSNVYEGQKTQAVIDKFKPIVKDALNNYISELMNERITTALKPDVAQDQPTEPVEQTPEEPISKIVTTMVELEAFFTIRAMLADSIDPERLSYKDTENYFSILIDSNTRKWLCRLRLDDGRKSLIIPDENKKEVRIPIEGNQDLFAHKNELAAVVDRYLK